MPLEFGRWMRTINIFNLRQAVVVAAMVVDNVCYNIARDDYHMHVTRNKYIYPKFTQGF